MAYGTIQGVQDILLQYADFIEQATITADMVNRFLVKASGQIDAILSKKLSKASIPLASPPQIIHNMADDLAVCQVLERHSVGKDPDETEFLKSFCVLPITELKELIDENPALFDPDISGAPLALSNRIGHDRKFTTTQTQNGVTIGDEGTMKDW